jgi:rhodanese-related sulfurtransferase
MRLKLIIAVVFLLFGTQGFSQQKVKKISATDFYMMMNQREDCAILDASPLKVFSKIRIEGARSIAKSEMIAKALKDVDKETPVLVYCENGDRSKVAAKKIAEKGFKFVYELKDGLYTWKEKGYPLDKTRLGKKEKKSTK